MFKQSQVLSAAETLEVQLWDLPSLIAVPAEMVRHTAKRLDELELAAYDEGFARGQAEGYQKGYETGADFARSQARKLSELFDYLARPMAAIDAQVEQDLVAMTIE